MKSQFNEGDKVMILNGDRCGHYAIVCSSDGEFSAVNVNDQVYMYHNNNLKHEDECVFTDEDLGQVYKSFGLPNPNTLSTAHENDDLGLCEGTDNQMPSHYQKCVLCNHYSPYSEMNIDGECSECELENGAETSRSCQESDIDFQTGILPEDAKERKTYPMYEGLLKYFPRALAQVSHRSYLGGQQHHPNQPLHWDRNKSTDELDALLRHMVGGEWDCVAWRALAYLEKQLEKGWKPEDD